MTVRYAGYIRISNEEQIGNFSLAAQKHAIAQFIQQRGDGELVEIYVDEAESARTTHNRDAFLQMRQDARKKKFDALVVHKWDRLNRNRMDSLAVKSLLRQDLGIKVYSVTEPSEDSDGPLGALIEGIMEAIAEWYSKNLSQEYKKGKREIWRQGRYNGGKRLFGYTVDENLILQPKADEVPGVLLAFETYATGDYSYVDIANLLNDAGWRSITGRRFTRDCIRSLLQNPTYISRLRYSETLYDSAGKRIEIPDSDVEWTQGAHEPIISEELFQQVEEARRSRLMKRDLTSGRKNSYTLFNLVYCWYCFCLYESGGVEGAFEDFGKCYAVRSVKKEKYAYSFYYCRSRRLGYGNCTQKQVRADAIEAQVLDVLMRLQLPVNWKTRLLEAMARDTQDGDLEKRLGEIRAAIERIDFRWDSGFFMDRQEYLQKRSQLQEELNALMPMLHDSSLEQAADLITNFAGHWAACKGEAEAQNHLLRRILERVYVMDKTVVALTFKADIHLLLTETINAPAIWRQADGYIGRIVANDDELATSRPRRESNPRPTV